MCEADAERSGSDRIKKIHACVSKIKSSEEMGVKYMQTWEEKVMERNKGREEGRAEGREEGRAEGRAEDRAEAILELLEDIGEVSDTLREKVMTQKDMDTLKQWHKAAARAESVEAFEEEILPK